MDDLFDGIDFDAIDALEKDLSMTKEVELKQSKTQRGSSSPHLQRDPR